MRPSFKALVENFDSLLHSHVDYLELDALHNDASASSCYAYTKDDNAIQLVDMLPSNKAQGNCLLYMVLSDKALGNT